MSDRIPGQSVMERLFLGHDQRRPRKTVEKVFGVPPIHADELSWYTGAIGEQVVARTLTNLPTEWHVFHSLPIGSGDTDIDHVVISPGGVFCLNTKHHRGKRVWIRDRAFWINGQRTNYISASEGEAKRLTKVLRTQFPLVPDVRPVLVVVGSQQIDEKKAPAIVRIEGGRTVGSWLTKQGRRSVLTLESVEAIAAFVDEPTNWRPVPSVDRRSLSVRFQTLTRELNTARRIRVAWVLAIIAVIAPFAVALIR